jgi:hypothetical protein
MAAISPWLRQLGTWVIATGVAEVVNSAAAWYEKTYSSPEGTWSELIAKSAFLSALVSRHGLGAAAECYKRGIISGGELFYCTVLSWAVYDAPLSRKGIESLEAYGIENANDVVGPTTVTVARANATEMTNNIEALGRAMAHVRSFAQANGITSVIPS